MDVERPDHGHVARDGPQRVTRRPLGLQLFASAQDEPRSRARRRTLAGMQAVSQLYLPNQIGRVSQLYGAIAATIVTLG
jgi:hypothetical protein